LPLEAESTGETFVRVALAAFGGPARRSAQKQDKLRFALEQAHIAMLPEAFVALTWLATFAVFILSLLLVVLGILLASAVGSGPDAAIAAVLVSLPVMLAGITFVALQVYPDYHAGERRRQIDRDLPYAVNFIAAMSSAGVVPTVLLRDLARETTYGEVSKEIAWMIRDIDLLGIDLVTAITRAIARSPSLRFQEFLQGSKTTILSGGDLKNYFSSKAEQYMAENRRVQREFLEGLGVLAESYVTVVIAGPLFMLVMLSIMLVVGRSTGSSQTFLFMLIFLLLPMTHGAFSWVLKNMAPES
jgi:flagellar protein FlaJ